MSDVDAALHPTGASDIDRHQISRKQAPTLVVVRKMKFLRSVNVGRFAAVHQHDRATDNVLVYEG